MKKQLFSLVMMLALVVLAGTSAWAQPNAAINASTSTYTMIAGSTHEFSVTRGRVGSDLAWTVSQGINGSGDATGDYTLVSPDATSPVFEITWNEDATIGSYTIQVTETNDGADGGCLTVRRFYVFLIDFDVLVYASDATGLELTTAAQLATCGDGNTTNYGNEVNGQAFNNVFNTNGDLDAYLGAAADDRSATTKGYTERYVTIALVWNATTPLLDIPAIDHLILDYTATVAPASTLVNVLGAGGTANAPTSLTVPSTSVISAPATLPTGTTNSAYTVFYRIPITFQDRWLGTTTTADITATFSAANVDLYDGSGTPVLIGTEPLLHESAPNLVNVSAEQTIYLAPATSTISVN